MKKHHYAIALGLLGLTVLGGCAQAGKLVEGVGQKLAEGAKSVRDWAATGALFQDRASLLALADKSYVGDEYLETIIAATESGDGEPVYELFSPHAKEEIEDLRDEVEALLAFFDGPVDTHEQRGSTDSLSTGKAGTVWKWRFSYTVTTSGSVYRVRIYAFTDDDTDADNIGVYKIEVLNEKEGSSFVIE